MSELILGKKIMATYNIKVKDIQYSDSPEYKGKNADEGEAGRVRKPQKRKVLVNQHRYFGPYTISCWRCVLSKGVTESHL